VFTLRFDMRAPAIGASPVDLYRTALELAAWAETRGAATVIVSEHHASVDGYLPAPMMMAAALASRTNRVPIMVAIVTLPLYDPVRLAEELCVLDLLSNGRVSYVGGVGYRPIEYEMFGVDFHRRGAIAEESLDLLLRAKTGEPFDHDGRHLQVTPAPITPGGPRVAWGGGSPAAARRAGRFGLDFLAERGDPELGVAYREACLAHGHQPGNCYLPPKDAAHAVFVADDVDRAWDELGPYLLHDARAYAEWNRGGKEGTSSVSFAETVAALRAEAGSYRILTVEEAIAYGESGGLLGLHPLIGGLPPEVAWRYVETVVERVEPALAG